MSKNESRYVDFRAVKAAVTMEQILAHYGLTETFKRGKDSLSGPCPIHKGSNPTQFRVCISKNCWNCFSECKGGGNVLDFVARMETVAAMEAANLIVDWLKLDRTELNRGQGVRDGKAPPKTVVQEAATAASSEVAVDLRTNSGASKVKEKIETGPNKVLGFKLELDVTHPYLTERGLLPGTVQEFGLGFCTKGVMAQRIAIPIHNVHGDLVGYAGRWPGEPPDTRPKYRLPDGFKKSVEIFNLARALREPSDRPLVLVEGFFDVMRLWQLGVRRVAALMGSSLSSAQEKLLAESLPAWDTIMLMLDEDEAGRRGRDEILRRIAEKMFVRIVVFAEDGFQPDRLTKEEAQLLGLLPHENS